MKGLVSTIDIRPQTLAIIGSLFWKIFIQFFSFIILFAALLSIGLMPYFGQKEITKEEENYATGQEKIINEWRNRANELEREITKLKQNPSN
ncbi:MAG: hypothetical protein PHQ86_08855 [Dehalococcoidales bacterium]|nr:hypothetical protein [Dehalococcoidales bacterium]